ncbi:MAG: hypothetical protein ABIC40_01330, partial [bacterium]
YVAGLYKNNPESGMIDEGHGSYIAKYSPDGREKWRFKWELYPLNIIAGNDSLYLIGQFFDKTDFDPGKGEDYIDLISAGFLTKFTSDGKYVGTRPFPSYMMVTNINSIALDSKGNLLIGGGESVNPRNGKDSREYCGVLYKLDPDANDIWSRRWAGGAVGCYVTCISVDNNDNIFVGGTLSFGQTMWNTGNPDMDPSEKWDTHRIHKDDIYLSKFDTDGNFMWSGTWGNDNMEWVRSIANDKSGGIYMLGSFDGTVDFDPGPGKSIVKGTGLEAFLLKLQE